MFPTVPYFLLPEVPSSFYSLSFVQLSLFKESTEISVQLVPVPLSIVPQMLPTGQLCADIDTLKATKIFILITLVRVITPYFLLY